MRLVKKFYETTPTYSPEMSIKKIISGGQTGVDQAALQAAIDSGLAHGGWCPSGRVCESGKIPDHFDLNETPKERSNKAPDVPRSLRTEWNVRDSDGTLIIQPKHLGIDPGTAWTMDAAKIYNKPLIIVDPSKKEASDRVKEWLNQCKIETLNVAGPSERSVLGISNVAYKFVRQVLKDH